MLYELFTRFVKFGIVGAVCAFIDFGITAWAKEKLNYRKLVSNTMGFCTAVISNFFLNRYFTFGAIQSDIKLQFLKFLCVALIGLGLNNLIVYILSEIKSKNFYFSKVLATGVVMFWNFFANYWFTFK